MNGPKAVVSKKTTSKKRRTRKPKAVEHPLSSEKLFTNREVGWLRFNRRVLAEAEDSRNPILERLRFLSISSSNMDEFFMKRVGGLKRQVAYGVSPKSADGQTPSQQLATIRQIVLPTVQEQDRCFEKVLKPAMAEQGIFLVKWADLTAKEKELVKNP